MTTITKRRHSLSFTEKLDLVDFMKSIVETPENSPAFYKSGWSDEAIAKRMKCSSANVRGVRKHIYPNFVDKYKIDKPPAKPKSVKVADLQSQIDDLRNHVLALEEELCARLRYLEEGLGVTPPKAPK